MDSPLFQNARTTIRMPAISVSHQCRSAAARRMLGYPEHSDDEEDEAEDGDAGYCC